MEMYLVHSVIIAIIFKIKQILIFTDHVLFYLTAPKPSKCLLKFFETSSTLCKTKIMSKNNYISPTRVNLRVSRRKCCRFEYKSWAHVRIKCTNMKAIRDAKHINQLRHWKFKKKFKLRPCVTHSRCVSNPCESCGRCGGMGENS